jgi:hypothetical protein
MTKSSADLLQSKIRLMTLPTRVRRTLLDCLSYISLARHLTTPRIIISRDQMPAAMDKPWRCGDVNEIEIWHCAPFTVLPRTFADDANRDGNHSRACKEVRSSNRQGLSAARAGQSSSRS